MDCQTCPRTEHVNVEHKEWIGYKCTSGRVWMGTVWQQQNGKRALLGFWSQLQKGAENWSQFSSVHFSRSVMSNSLRPHELQHTRLPYPSPSQSLVKLMSIEPVMPRWCPENWFSPIKKQSIAVLTKRYSHNLKVESHFIWWECLGLWTQEIAFQ